MVKCQISGVVKIGVLGVLLLMGPDEEGYSLLCLLCLMSSWYCDFLLYLNMPMSLYGANLL